MERLLVIENPRASRASPHHRKALARLLSCRYDLSFQRTEGPGHGAELALQAAAEGYAACAAVGGDGTVNEVANGLAATASNGTALALLPAGQADVLARGLGVPRGMSAAANHLLGLAGKARLIDLGEAEGRLFTFAAGVGFEAEVAREVERRPQLKARFGPWFYTVTALRVVRRYRKRSAELLATSANAQRRGVAAVVQNAAPYTYFGRFPVTLSAHAGLQSGTLACSILLAARARYAPSFVWQAVFRGKPLGLHPAVAELPPAEEVSVESAAEPLALHLDGDYVGTVRTATFRVRPKALLVLA